MTQADALAIAAGAPGIDLMERAGAGIAKAIAARWTPRPLVVLAGGQAKQGDATGWLSQLRRQAAAVVLYGAAREAFSTLLADADYQGQVHSCEGLAEAVPLANELAQSTSCRSVLLSPACASFDQYRDFEARGDHFRELVAGLPPLE
jgi:UDP-N-acetylmuramoylalanine--D-glutamate ligase